MNIEDIIRMAQEAGFGDRIYEEHEYELACFAALVAATEREMIARSMDKQADLAPDEIDRQWAQEMAAVIRARSNSADT